MKLLIFAGLSEKKLISKILPITCISNVESIYLIRNIPLKFDRVIDINVPLIFGFPFFQEAIKLIFGIWICLTKKVDYIISFYLIPHGILGYIVGKVLRKPVIQVSLGEDILFYENHKILGRRILLSSKHIGTRGTQSQKRLQKLIQKSLPFFSSPNVFIIPPKKIIELKKEHKNFDIISVTNFSRAKRLDIFLKIVKKIKEDYPEIKTLVIGGGKGKTIFQKYRNKMGLNRNVEFLGYTNHVDAYLMRSKIFILTSEIEGLPMAMLEAMSLGIPCVVPDVGDIKDVAINEHNALVVNPLDVENFVIAVKRLLTEPNLYRRLSENAFTFLQEKKYEYSLDNIKNIWKNLFSI